MKNTNGRSSLRQHVRDLAARPGGVSYAEVTGFATSQVSSALWRLKTDGEVFAAKISHRNVSYFADPIAAKRYEAEHREKGDRNGTPMSYTGQHIGHAGKHQRAWWPADAPAVITSSTKITIAPPPPTPTKSNTYTEWGG